MREGVGDDGGVELLTLGHTHPVPIQHEPDDDEMTNTKAGARLHHQQATASTTASGGERKHSSAGGVSTMAGGEDRGRGRGVPTHHTSQWIIDGDELPRADIEVR